MLTSHGYAAKSQINRLKSSFLTMKSPSLNVEKISETDFLCSFFISSLVKQSFEWTGAASKHLHVASSWGGSLGGGVGAVGGVTGRVGNVGRGEEGAWPGRGGEERVSLGSGGALLVRVGGTRGLLGGRPGGVVGRWTWARA